MMNLKIIRLSEKKPDSPTLKTHTEKYLCMIPFIENSRRYKLILMEDTPTADWGGRRQGGGKQKDYNRTWQNSLGVMDVFIILVVMMVLHIFTYIKTSQTAHFKYLQFNCTLIRAVFFFKYETNRLSA